MTQLVPFEMVDAVLAETGAVQSRVRMLPSRVVVYLLLAGCLFTDLGWTQVWQRLVAGLPHPVRTPTASALSQARRRIGSAPLKALFELIRGPAPTMAVQARWRGLLLAVLDGTTITVPDSEANLAIYVRQQGRRGGTGYPMMRLSVLITCATRSVIDAVFSPISDGESKHAARLAGSLGPATLLIADRNYAIAAFITELAANGTDLLIRCKNGRLLPVCYRYRDGSYLTIIGTTTVRVIQARITITTARGSRTETYRLLTTLTDHHTHPAADLIALYHQRWDIETAYRELKSTILRGHVLRARTPDGLDQEIYALLITYQALRTAMTDATDTQPGLNPDRGSFTIALNTARDQVIHAAGIITDTITDLIGVIGAAILADPLPPRRTRTAKRAVKQPTSKYAPQSRSNTDRTTYKATISTTLTPPISP